MKLTFGTLQDLCLQCESTHFRPIPLPGGVVEGRGGYQMAAYSRSARFGALIVILSDL